MVDQPKIGVVLPSRESFGILKSGAVALCARDFARCEPVSRFDNDHRRGGLANIPTCDICASRIGGDGGCADAKPTHARIVRVALEEGFAVLEIQNRPSMVEEIRRRLPRIKLALHLHNDPQTMAGSRSPADRARLLRQVDAIYCVSEFIRSDFCEGIGDDAGKTIVVYNGIAANLPTAPKERIVAFVGRVIAIKGVAELVRAFALAAPDLPEWRLVIAGVDAEGLLSGPRAPLAREREVLAARLTLMGQVSHAEAMALFARAEIAVVPSLWQEPLLAIRDRGPGQRLRVDRDPRRRPRRSSRGRGGNRRRERYSRLRRGVATRRDRRAVARAIAGTGQGEGPRSVRHPARDGGPRRGPCAAAGRALNEAPCSPAPAMLATRRTVGV